MLHHGLASIPKTESYKKLDLKFSKKKKKRGKRQRKPDCLCFYAPNTLQVQLKNVSSLTARTAQIHNIK